MADRQLAGWAASSQSPEEVSNRIKGVVLMFSSVIIFVAAQFFHLQLSATDVVTLATELSAIGGLLWSLYGAGVALVTWFATLQK